MRAGWRANMMGRLGGFALGATAACAAALSLVPPSQPLTAHLSMDIAAQPGAGMAWANAGTAPPPAILEIVGIPSLRGTIAEAPASARLAERRLRNALTLEMAKHFRLFLYVDKSVRGALPQRMFVFENRAAKLRLRYVWPVSTGREQLERDPTGRRVLTTTPTGYFELDPARFYRHYISAHWREAMPYAMFFASVENGTKTGLAIHGAPGRERALLGKRASAGCVRLAPENARTLFELIRENYRGPVPVPSFDRRSRSSSVVGEFARAGDGKIALSPGYQVLVLIDQPESGKQVAALL
jgi:lipoprotein-anchoring transpeptidase ErfK/SrfK